MSSNKKIITVRVSEKTYMRYKAKCERERRSMSAQGELLIDEFIGDEESTILYLNNPTHQNKISELVKQTMGET